MSERFNLGGESSTSVIVVCVVILIVIIFLLTWKTPAFSKKQPVSAEYSRKIDELLRQQDQNFAEMQSTQQQQAYAQQQQDMAILSQV